MARAKSQQRAPKVEGGKVTKRTLTLGELIAAAFDTVGNEASKVRRVVSSNDMAAAIGKRIVFV